jgi:hypothetical protein
MSGRLKERYDGRVVCAPQQMFCTGSARRALRAAQRTLEEQRPARRAGGGPPAPSDHVIQLRSRPQAAHASNSSSAAPPPLLLLLLLLVLFPPPRACTQVAAPQPAAAVRAGVPVPAVEQRRQRARRHGPPRSGALEFLLLLCLWYMTVGCAAWRRSCADLDFLSDT